MKKTGPIVAELRAGMREYLASLPEGARSFPECQADAGLVLGLSARGVLEGLALAPEVRDALGSARDGHWLPEIVHVAVLLALRDARFGGPAGDDALIEWVEGISRPLAVPAAGEGGPGDAAAAVRAAPEVWARFHRGTRLEVAQLGERAADLLYRHPDGIFPPVVLEWRRRVLLAMLAGAGAVTPSATLEARPGEGTAIHLAW